jgi:hypothetical protein
MSNRATLLAPLGEQPVLGDPIPEELVVLVDYGPLSTGWYRRVDARRRRIDLKA